MLVGFSNQIYKKLNWLPGIVVFMAVLGLAVWGMPSNVMADNFIPSLEPGLHGTGGSGGGGGYGGNGNGGDGGDAGSNGTATNGGTGGTKSVNDTGTASGEAGTGGGGGGGNSNSDPGDPGAPGADQTAVTSNPTPPSSITNPGQITISVGPGGSGGGGGAGGDGGWGSNGYQASGGAGGKGGNGGNSDNYTITLFDNLDSETIRDKVLFKTSNGGFGGQGGQDGDDNNGADAGVGGLGGAGGDGGKSGDLVVNINSNITTFTDSVTVTAGDGGSVLATRGSSASGSGGDAGSVTINANNTTHNRTLVFLKDFNVTTGDAGQAAEDNVSNLAGEGGDATINADTVLVNGDTHFNFHLGTTTLAGANNGNDKGILLVDFNFLNIEAKRNSLLNITGQAMIEDEDDIKFKTLRLEPGSSFTANFTAKNGSTGYAVVDDPADDYRYDVDNLIVVTGATWKTAGSYKPVTAAGNFIYFDLSDILPKATVLTLNSDSAPGSIELTNFDPVTQQKLYIDDPKRPRYADDPRYPYESKNALGLPGDPAYSPAFISSQYQTKRLHLEDVTLADRTTGTIGTNNHYDGSTVDDFGFTAGLRRYYWDIYQVQGDVNVNKPLVANNFYTADASKILAQGSLAALNTETTVFANGVLKAIETAADTPNTDRIIVGTTITGQTNKIETGSDIDIDNIGVIVTTSSKSATLIGESTLGLFFEYGHGDYDAYSNVYRYGEIKGDGKSDIYAGGLFVHNAFNQGTYVELSARGGGIKNEFKVNSDPYVLHPEVHSYDTSTGFIGAHLGVGHKLDLAESTKLDVYLKSLWNHTFKDRFETRFGDDVEIDAIDSVKTRLGGRVSQDFADGLVKGYFGAAWEQEYKGEASGRLGLDPIINAPETKGASAFGELGINIKPTENKNFSIDLSAFGNVGRQEGIGGSLGLNFDF